MTLVSIAQGLMCVKVFTIYIFHYDVAFSDVTKNRKISIGTPPSVINEITLSDQRGESPKDDATAGKAFLTSSKNVMAGTPVFRHGEEPSSPFFTFNKNYVIILLMK